MDTMENATKEMAAALEWAMEVHSDK